MHAQLNLDCCRNKCSCYRKTRRYNIVICASHARRRSPATRTMTAGWTVRNAASGLVDPCSYQSPSLAVGHAVGVLTPEVNELILSLSVAECCAGSTGWLTVSATTIAFGSDACHVARSITACVKTRFAVEYAHFADMRPKEFLFAGNLNCFIVVYRWSNFLYKLR